MYKAKSIVSNPFEDEFSPKSIIRCNQGSIEVLDTDFTIESKYKIITALQLYYLHLTHLGRNPLLVIQKSMDYILGSNNPSLPQKEDTKIDIAILLKGINPKQLKKMTPEEAILSWCLFGPSYPQVDIYMWCNQRVQKTQKEELLETDYKELRILLNLKFKEVLESSNIYSEAFLKNISTYQLSVEDITLDKIKKSYLNSKKFYKGK